MFARDDNATFIFWHNGSLNFSPSGWTRYVWACTYKVDVLCWTFKQNIKKVCMEHGLAKGFNGNWIFNGWDIKVDHRVHGSIPTIKEANMGFGWRGRCLWEVLEDASTQIEFIIAQWDMAHNYVNNNTNIMAPWVRWNKHSKPTHHMFNVVAMQNLTPLQLHWP